MIANVPLMLIVLMFLLTLLGGAIGYCIALLMVKKSVQRALHAHRLEEDRLISIVKDKQAADDNIFAPSDFAHLGIMAEQTVTAEPAPAVENGNRAEHSSNNNDGDLRVSQPPILSQRIGSIANEKHPRYSTVNRLSLDFANSRSAELDIPVIAESELPDEVDALDFRYPRFRDGGVKEGA